MSVGTMTVVRELLEQTPLEKWPFPSATVVEELGPHPHYEDVVIYTVRHPDIPAGAKVTPVFQRDTETDEISFVEWGFGL